MQRMIVVATLITFACLNACSGANSEAAHEAQSAWDQFFTKCGGTYYYALAAQQILGVQASPNMLEEFRGVNVDVKSSPLSQADTLNGVEWKGFSRLTVASSRMYMGGWQDWIARDYVYTIDLEKRSGQWNVGKPAMMGLLAVPAGVKLNCSDIPK